jgi:hypothetical protein
MHSQSLTIDNTLGAVLVAVIAAAFLHGVACIQAWHYFTHQNDAWPIKALVSAVIIFDTVHQALISVAAYIYVISDFGNFLALQYVVRIGLVEVIFTALTTLLVQSFMTVRVWRLSNGNVWLVGLILILVVGEFASSVAYTCMAFRIRTFSQLDHLKSLSITMNALAAGGDMLIAAALCTLLHMCRTSFYRSNTIINKLIMYAVNTGCVTTLFALASLISLTTSGEKFIYIAFYFCIGRLYSNSLLATLNGRDKIRSAADRDGVFVHQISTTVIAKSRNPILGGSRNPIVFSHDSSNTSSI